MPRPFSLIALTSLVMVAADSPKTNSAAESSLLKHIQILAGDEFEGRGPGTIGEEKSVAYISDQLKSIGLKPGNPNGSYLQQVPLLGFQTKASALVRVGDIAFPAHDAGRLGRGLSSSNTRGQDSRNGCRLRGLWRGGPGIWLGRL